MKNMKLKSQYTDEVMQDIRAFIGSDIDINFPKIITDTSKLKQYWVKNDGSNSQWKLKYVIGISSNNKYIAINEDYGNLSFSAYDNAILEKTIFLTIDINYLPSWVFGRPFIFLGKWVTIQSITMDGTKLVCKYFNGHSIYITTDALCKNRCAIKHPFDDTFFYFFEKKSLNPNDTEYWDYFLGE